MSFTTSRDGEASAFDRAALLSLLRLLEAQGYRFVTPTPGTHTRIVARPGRQQARALRDVLGWSLPFTPEMIAPDVLDLLRAAGALEEQDGMLKARVRVSSVLGTLFLHSAFPTLAADSVFLGPDSYRFADFIVARMAALAPGGRILDYGAGAGVGGISAARQQSGSVLTLADINPKALFLSSINAEFAGLEHRTVEATAPGDVPDAYDLIVTHPPFMMDDQDRAYRHGGDLYGARLSLDWVIAGARKLVPGGQLILHTGVSIVDGRDVLLDELTRAFRGSEWRFVYHELDPDIFSEDLDQPAYADVERIAAVGLVVTRDAG
ncbi:methyltransferase [Sphingomonas sp. PL-96]|uniref:methyltransferase n=1 Tax=Sphingomonas sp. PL-96 TaxID=2887201 RepID=UPI001E55C85B|nr:methyltransferase [Sphingomonas sp. PL-96]MCC2976591.1 methyltransferase [Sphingomonas sp. PL-96]